MTERTSGFTLAELLIALVILGVIATFTIPKVLQSQQDQQKKAVFRETLATLMDIQHQGIRSGQLVPGNFKSYFFSKLNAIKLCPTDASTQGCWSIPVQGDSEGEMPEAGFVLPNGAAVAGMEAGTDFGAGQWPLGVVIDWNGQGPPNTLGNDQLAAQFCYGSANCSCCTYNGAIRPDTMGPGGSSNDAANYALWTWIFQ